MLKSLLVAGLASATLFAFGGCVTELPGAVYHVRLSAPPDLDECVELGKAISAAVGASFLGPSYQEFRPWSSKKTCLVDMFGHNAPRPCRITVSTSTGDPTIYLSITESDGAGFKKLSPSSEDISRKVRALLTERYPSATILDLHPVQGPFAP